VLLLHEAINAQSAETATRWLGCSEQTGTGAAEEITERAAAESVADRMDHARVRDPIDVHDGFDSPTLPTKPDPHVIP
jgi:hypothetical protein